VKLAVDLLDDLDAGDFASIAATADQARAIEHLLLEEARTLPMDTADLAGVFLDRVAERIGGEAAALLLGVLATARSGFAPADLAALLADDPDAGLKVAGLQRILGDQLRTVDAAGRLTFAHAGVRLHASCFVDTAAHARIVEVLDAHDTWDDVDALDAVWHTIAAGAVNVGGQGELAAALARAVNHRPASGELVLMRALDAHPGPGIALVGRVDRSMLGDEGMKLLLKAPRAVDRRYLRPADRVDLGRVVLGLARAGEAGTRDWQVCAALNNLGADCLFVGDLDGAHDAFEQSSECSRRLAREQPESERAKSDLSVALNGIGDVLEAQGDFHGAQAAYEETLEMCRGLVRAQPDSLPARRELSVALNRIGAIRRLRGDLDGALSAYQESLELARALARGQPGSVLAQSDLGVALNRIGGVLQARGDLDGAQAAFEEMLELDRAVVQAQPGSVRAQRDLSVALGWIGSVRRARGDLEGALTLFEEALELFRELARAQPDSVDAVEAVVGSLTNVAIVRRECGDPAAARTMIDEAVPLAREACTAHPDLVEAKSDLASALTILADILDDLDGAAHARAEASALEA
jgi:tetratricopeptide (TPR) repeat protein